MIILITGAGGFVGTHLNKKLQASSHVEVIAVDEHMDVRTAEFPRADIVINLAALNSSKESIENPKRYFDTNVTGNFNMLEHARNCGAKYLYLATQKANEPNPYGASKKCAEVWCNAYAQTYDMPMIINQVGNLYGTGGNNFWVNIFMQKAKRGEIIDVWGNQSRDMLHIDDLIALLVDQILHFDKYKGTYPVGGGEKNILTPNKLLKWMNYDNVRRKEALSGLDEARVTDNTKVSEINGWCPLVSLDEGLYRTWHGK
jgi:nucleoside-diphosphate-sugar epimerase